jgi:3-methyl-2-oxobutanoate hydroxymethyltransferase
VYGIGAGPHVDGQVLVFHDMFGLFQTFTPRFAKRYADLGKQIVEGLGEYAREVRGGSFPTREHSFTIATEELDKLRKALGD